MNIFSVFAIGLLILFGAILLNYIAIILGLTSWYEFLKQPRYPGLLNLFWLFILYPFCLGVVAIYSTKLLN